MHVTEDIAETVEYYVPEVDFNNRRSKRNILAKLGKNLLGLASHTDVECITRIVEHLYHNQWFHRRIQCLLQRYHVIHEIGFWMDGPYLRECPGTIQMAACNSESADTKINCKCTADDLFSCGHSQDHRKNVSHWKSSRKRASGILSEANSIRHWYLIEFWEWPLPNYRTNWRAITVCSTWQKPIHSIIIGMHICIISELVLMYFTAQWQCHCHQSARSFSCIQLTFTMHRWNWTLLSPAYCIWKLIILV